LKYKRIVNVADIFCKAKFISKSADSFLCKNLKYSQHTLQYYLDNGMVSKDYENPMT